MRFWRFDPWWYGPYRFLTREREIRWCGLDGFGFWHQGSRLRLGPWIVEGY